MILRRVKCLISRLIGNLKNPLLRNRVYQALTIETGL